MGESGRSPSRYLSLGNEENSTVAVAAEIRNKHFQNTSRKRHSLSQSARNMSYTHRKNFFVKNILNSLHASSRIINGYLALYRQNGSVLYRVFNLKVDR
jgi:hypothetical protein